jgi:hypothetical protein
MPRSEGEETDARREAGILYRQIRVGNRKGNSATFDHWFFVVAQHAAPLQVQRLN